MPLPHVRPIGLLSALLLLASAACSAPAPAVGQGLTARVTATREGAVRFSYPSREGVCGTAGGVGYRDPRSNGRGLTFFGGWNGDRSGRRDGDCVPGPVEVVLTLRSGEVTDVSATVAQPRAGGGVSDAGTVSPEEAARFLLALAEQGRSETEDALLAAVLADADIAADLLRMARASALRRQTRQQAAFWVAIIGDREAVRQLHRLVEDASVDEELRGHTIFAIGQTQHADDAVFLRALYPRLPSEDLKEKTIFSLSQMRDLGSERWLLQVASDRRESADLREKAVFWLAESDATLADLDGLYATLDDQKLKEQVIFAYSRRDEPAAAERLLRLARTDPDGELRGKAIFWLSQTAGREVTRQLAGLVQDRNENRDIQEQAVFAISQRPRDESVPALVEIAREHRDPEIRKKALFWLGQSKDARALDLFAEILGSR